VIKSCTNLNILFCFADYFVEEALHSNSEIATRLRNQLKVVLGKIKLNHGENTLPEKVEVNGKWLE